MSEYNIYKDIAERTGGDVYLGVVGPVRTGKSTFIKKFMDLFVIPNMSDENEIARAQDELPQSADGKTIMTTEPKFIPNEAVEINASDNARMRVRLIDCVGYIVEEALGHTEDGTPRMVSTPWSDEPMEFGIAAEIGTKKVICDHSTIGIMITTDGSITDIPRESYVSAEARVAQELSAQGKPYIIILNTRYPTMPETEDLRAYLSNKYSAPVVAANCAELDTDGIKKILEQVLLSFPITQIAINLPDWVEALPDDHDIKNVLYTNCFAATENVETLSHLDSALTAMMQCDYVSGAVASEIDLGTGMATVDIDVPKELYYKTVKEMSGFDVSDGGKLLTLLTSLSAMKQEYDKIKIALTEVENKGYGIVTPTIDELSLEEPEIVRQGSRYGVKLRASAPSIHMIKANIETEVCPIVGTEKQSEELVHYLLSEFESNPAEIWQSNIFGKSLHELVNEGLNNKLNRMPDEAQIKLQETLQKIINEGSGGLICIIL